MISGQGTMGLEIIDQVRSLDAVVLPVGGGSLLAGVALAVKTVYPNIQIIVSLKFVYAFLSLALPNAKSRYTFPEVHATFKSRSR